MQNPSCLSLFAVHFRTTLYVGSVLLLSSCGSSGVETEPDQSALQLGAANPAPTTAVTNPSSNPTTGDSEQAMIPAQTNTPLGSEAPSASQPTDEIQTANLPPMIANTSYNCDPITEMASFDVGETDQFTLSVNDESPLTLTYSVDISSTETVSVNVAQNGVYTITALQPGESYLWLRAEDEQGLADEYELKVLVN